MCVQCESLSEFTEPSENPIKKKTSYGLLSFLCIPFGNVVLPWKDENDWAETESYKFGRRCSDIASRTDLEMGSAEIVQKCTNFLFLNKSNAIEIYRLENRILVFKLMKSLLTDGRYCCSGEMAAAGSSLFTSEKLIGIKRTLFSWANKQSTLPCRG